MPMRTDPPTSSMTWTTMSSPTMTRSPGFRVMISMFSTSSLDRGSHPRGAGATGARAALGSLSGEGPGEQRSPDREVRRLVDHLMADTVRDKDRRAEVRPEVRELGTRADGHPDV